MKKTLLLTCTLALGLAGCSNAKVPDAKSPANVQQTADQIRTEALQKNTGLFGHALPLLASWNPGAYPRALGFSPAYQIGLIEKGNYLLPGFAFPNVASNAADIEKSRAYYEQPLKRAAALNLPITLIGTQWEQVLYQDKKYFDLPPDQNPNVVTTDAKSTKNYRRLAL